MALANKAGLDRTYVSGVERGERNIALRNFDFASYARFWFQEGTLEKKQSILRDLGSNLRLLNGKMALELQKHFLIMEKIAACNPDQFIMVAPEKVGALIRKSADSATEFPLSPG